MDIRGKRLLMLGGGAYFNHIKQYAYEAGFQIIAIGIDENAPYFQEADERYIMSFKDVDSVAKLVKDKKIDGLFSGANEASITAAIRISEKAEIPFYCSQWQWDVIANKRSFKQIARACGVPIVPEFRISSGYTADDLEKIIFPVMIKPADSSGAHGLNVCRDVKDFDRFYQEALKFSRNQEVIVEELITDAQEVFFQYTIQNGVVSLSSAFTKVYTKHREKYYSLPLFHMYPSRYMPDYYRLMHEPIVRMVEKLEIQNGCFIIQSFHKNDCFYVFEAGYRLGGAQNYIFTDYFNHTNSLNYMVNLALTGKMSEEKVADRDKAYFTSPCCNYYVGLNAGTIGSMEGINEVRQLPGVLNVTQLTNVGDSILDTNSLDRICLRIHVVGSSDTDLARKLVRICDALTITSTDGKNMIMEHLTYEGCLQAIHDSTIY